MLLLTRIDPDIKPPIDDYTNLPNSLLKQTLGLQNRQHGQYLGQTSSYDTRLINLSPFNARGEYASTPGTLRRVSPQTHFIMKSESTAETDEELANLDLVESIVQPHGKALVDLYFRIVHPSFPIMHKNVFLEKYARSYREFTPPMLASVYILALNWWTYDPDLANLPKPDVHKLEKLALRFMVDLLNRPKLSTVQSGLLLLQRPEGDSWALTGQLIAVSQELGLHLDSTKWRIPDWERGLRRRLAWALYMQDKWGALIHGRPCLIHSDDWGVRPVDLRDFPETAEDDSEEEGSSEIEKGRLCFINMISLTEILTEILDTFFTLKATSAIAREGDNAITATLERAKPIQLKLKEWYTNLPSLLAVGETKARKLSSTGALHLAYFAAEITLHRAILRPFPPPVPSANPSSPSSIHHITRAAAKTRFTNALALVSKLDQTHLQSFWYFSSKTNLAIIATFGSLLWATSETPEEATWYREKLAEYRWLLRVNSKSAEFMGFTVSMLDASAVFTREKDKDGSKTTTPASIHLQKQTMHNTEDEEDTSMGEMRSPSSRQEVTHPRPTDMTQYASGNNTIASSHYYTNTIVTSPINTTSGPSPSTSIQDPQSASTFYNNNTEFDTRPSWNELVQSNGFTFNGNDVQDWNLDQLYSFENFPLATDVLSHSRRYIQEYEEENLEAFSGF